MERTSFLGTIDRGITRSLLKTYSAPTKPSNDTRSNEVKQNADSILIQLGSLLSAEECDEILLSVGNGDFQSMTEQYDVQTRNNSRLTVFDGRLARTLWRRLKFENRITKAIRQPKPLGFSVQGVWKMSGVNEAMRINKYHQSEHFAPHKDAQYAPSGDERSILSLIIYLNDHFDEGETKFYFPKQPLESSMKGQTIKEEIEAYGGLEHGYDCVTIKPKKGHAILFSHNLLHEGVAPKTGNFGDGVERFVLRTDVVARRAEKPRGFAISAAEQDDYQACLNFFREAQQMELQMYNNYGEPVKASDVGELYERSLSIRYSYPRLLSFASEGLSINEAKSDNLFERLPVEMWISIIKHLDERDVQHLIFAFPDFHLLKIVWDAHETKRFKEHLFRQEFIPTIAAQYGSRTLFRFSDANFFNRHTEQCCRVAAVYAFFMLGHSSKATSYIARYDRNTHEVCEVELEKLLTDVFHNRNCYGSLYRVEQKHTTKRQPMVDLDHSVDRTHMTNRHQTQFIGQDLLTNLRFKKRKLSSSSDDEYEFDKLEILARQRKHALEDRNKKLVDRYLSGNRSGHGYLSGRWRTLSKDDTIGYRETLLRQIEQESGSTLCRMAEGDREASIRHCHCGLDNEYGDYNDIGYSTECCNHLVFDFNTHQLAVEKLTDPISQNQNRSSLLYDCVRTLQKSVSPDKPILFYQVNIEKLAQAQQGFNHASCQCGSVAKVEIDQYSFLDYTTLSHVHLAIAQNNDHVFVLATYGGIAAL